MSFFTPEEQRRWDLFNGPQRDPTAAAKKHGFTYQSRRARRGAVLTPHDFMPCGPYTGMHLHAVPAAHLLWVQSQPWASTWPDWAPVADYLTRHPHVAEGSADTPVRSDFDPPTAEGTFHSSQSEGRDVNFFIDALRPCIRTPDWKWSHDAILYTLPGHEPELHAFACGALGLRIPWYLTTQPDPATGQPRPILPHYRISSTRHALALQHLCVHLVDASTLARHTAEWSQHLSQNAADTPACNFLVPPRPKPFQQAFPTGATCGCTKRPYSKKDAQAQLNARTRSQRDPNRHLRIYECPHCHHWHLTHQPLRQ